MSTAAIACTKYLLQRVGVATLGVLRLESFSKGNNFASVLAFEHLPYAM